MIDNTSPGCDLNQPEGIAFGPDGNLYVTSLRADTADDKLTDKILIVKISDGKGTCIDKIELDEHYGDRALALTLLFGPNNSLLVPIAGPTGGKDTGAIRRYDVKSKTFDYLVPRGPNNPLIRPRYLTFRKMNPATLAYEP